MREIYLHAKDDDESTINFAVANAFYKELHILEKRISPILLHINTIGGDWDDGMAIYDVVKYSSCPINAIGHGCVYSMGSLILQAAKKRYLMPHCSFMVHLGSTSFDGEFQTAASTIEFYENGKSVMLEIYSERCQKGEFFVSKGMDKKKTEDFIYKKLREKTDWYMTAKEAVYYGFADKVLTHREYINVRKSNKTTNRRNQ